MGRHVPRLTSPITGRTEPAVDARACVFAVDDEGLRRWRRWWRFANVEQTLTFVVVTIVTIVFTSVLAWSTLHGRPDLPNSIDFLRIEGDVLAERGGLWFGRLFWVVGSYSLFAASVGVIDYTARLAADVLKWTYLRRKPIGESGLYAGIVWALVVSGCADPALRPRSAPRPAGDLGLQRRGDDVRLRAAAHRPESPDSAAGHRDPAVARAALVLAAMFFGGLAALTIAQQVQRLLGR